MPEPDREVMLELARRAFEEGAWSVFDKEPEGRYSPTPTNVAKRLIEDGWALSTVRRELEAAE